MGHFNVDEISTKIKLYCKQGDKVELIANVEVTEDPVDSFPIWNFLICLKVDGTLVEQFTLTRIGDAIGDKTRHTHRTELLIQLLDYLYTEAALYADMVDCKLTRTISV